MRPALVTITFLALSALAGGAASSQPAQPAPPAPAAPVFGAPVFVLTGGGLGHGVGMSQWGAYGQASEGKSYADILAYYYRGTELGQASVTKVRVLVAAGRKQLVLSSRAPFRVRDAAGVVFDLPAGTLTLRPELVVPIDGIPAPLLGPLTFLPASGSRLSLGPAEYRGELRVLSDGVKLQAVNVLRLEAYLLGVVPREMPSRWPLEALKAQAVAARTYALAKLVQGESFDLYADGRSQVYGGVGAEAPGTTQAVRETSGQVVLYEGSVATTLFFSSSGGRTARAIDVFGLDLPYLDSVPDPWDEASPHHVWQPQLLTAKQIATAFKLSAPVVDVQVGPTAYDRVGLLTLATKAGDIVEVSPIEFRRRLALRSTAFRLGVLRLGRSAASIAPGARIRLTGVARDVQDAVLERLGADGLWAPVARLVLQQDGTFTTVLRPKETSRYRLVASGLAGPALTVKVASGAES